MNNNFKSNLMGNINQYAGMKKVAAANLVVGQLMEKVAACSKHKSAQRITKKTMDMSKAAAYLVSASLIDGQ